MSVKKLLQRLAGSKPVIVLIDLVVRLWGLTTRVEVVDAGPWIEHVEKGGTVLFAVWHQQFFSALRPFQAYGRRYHPVVMVSRSRDGDLGTYIGRSRGFRVVRGSSSSGGSAALREAIRAIRETRVGAHLVDGPRGPAGRVKPGVIALARATGARIVPMYLTLEKAWYARSWDRFCVPKPFSRVVLRFADGIDLEVTKDPDELERQRLALERRMRAAIGLEEALEDAPED